MVRSNLDGPVKRNKGTVSNAENSSSTGVSDSEVSPVEKKKKVPEKTKGKISWAFLRNLHKRARKRKKNNKVKKNAQ